MKSTKTLGQYFTPEHVANFMIGLSRASKSAKILEPSCGEGVFIKLLQEKGYKNLLGFEIDASLEFVTDAEIRHKSFISEKFTEKYDLIIGNPPYIRWKNLVQELKSELDSNELWQEYFNSLCDYLYIFILKSVELLNAGGELIFITPEYWINTKHAQILREYLVKNGYFTDIIHFSETPIFNNVASSIVIFRFVKSKNSKPSRQQIEIIRYLSSQKLSADILTKIQSGHFSESEKFKKFHRDQFLPKKRWILAPRETEEKLKWFENKCAMTVLPSHNEKTYFTLGDIADIGNGMVSGLDRAFQIPKGVKLTKKEEKANISVLKAKNIERYIHGELTTYIFLNGDVKTEADLKEKYPTFHKLLNEHREKLEKRYHYNRTVHFWEWVFLRSFNLFKQERQRIFVPCKERISHKDYFRFACVSRGVFPTQDVTAIFLKPGIRESLYYVLALLNSKHIFEWLRYKGVVKGNIVEFSETPLASIPIKRINWGNSNEVQLHNDITNWCQKLIARPSDETLGVLNEKVATLF